MQSIRTQGRLIGRLLLTREGSRTNYQYARRDAGWEVDVLVKATDWWSFYWIIQIILSSFSTDYLYVKIFALGRSVSLIFCTARFFPFSA